jgi:anti-sigma factor RsiW
MNHPASHSCDETLLNRYLDDDLDPRQRQRMADHLHGCRHCQEQLDRMRSFSRDLNARIETASARVDFTALEKQVLNEALRTRHRRNGPSRFMAALKYTVPAAATAGLLLFFAYTRFWVQPTPAPSAIINSFTGSMSSVMIFETPETRQTVLWYNEATDMEDDQDAV